MNKMQAIVMNQPGGPEVLELRSLPLPELSSARHVRVRLHAAGVNPVDTKLRANGTYYPDRLPTILGCDGAGVVEAVGDQVTRVQPHPHMPGGQQLGQRQRTDLKHLRPTRLIHDNGLHLVH